MKQRERGIFRYVMNGLSIIGAVMALVARDMRKAIEEHIDKQMAKKSGRAYRPVGDV